jgi:hypothetical protein
MNRLSINYKAREEKAKAELESPTISSGSEDLEFVKKVVKKFFSDWVGMCFEHENKV